MRAALAALAFLAAIAPANAATFEAVTLADGRPALKMAGDIEPGDDRKFSRADVAQPRPVAVVLSGEGGNADAAMRIGMVVRWLEMETIVPAGETCASACAFIWAAGKPLAIGDQAHVGFHGAYIPTAGTPQRSEAGSALLAIYLKQLGYEDAAVSYMTSAPPQRMTWLLAEDAVRLRLHIVEAPSVASE